MEKIILKASKVLIGLALGLHSFVQADDVNNLMETNTFLENSFFSKDYCRSAKSSNYSLNDGYAVVANIQISGDVILEHNFRVVQCVSEKKQIASSIFYNKYIKISGGSKDKFELQLGSTFPSTLTNPPTGMLKILKENGTTVTYDLYNVRIAVNDVSRPIGNFSGQYIYSQLDGRDGSKGLIVMRFYFMFPQG